MRAAALVAASLAIGAHAHFKLSYPEPRGLFSEDDEPTFCDNYANAVDNRTTFPLSNGFIELFAGHPTWSLGVEISTKQNPTSFANFTVNNTDGSDPQLARAFASGSGEGNFCIPLNLSSTGITGVKDGANVTIQIVFDGGDGHLYQCADLTLSANASVPSGCTNATSSGGDDGGDSGNSNSTSTSGNSTGASGSSSQGGGAMAVAVPHALPATIALGALSLLTALL